MSTEAQAVRVMGTLLKIYDNSNANPVQVTEVVEIDEQKTREILDATHLDSPDDYREKLPSLKNAGQIQVGLHWVPGDTTQAQLEADFESGFKRQFQIKLPAAVGGYERTFKAYVTSCSRPYKMDDIFRFNVTLEVTGKVTEAAPA